MLNSFETSWYYIILSGHYVTTIQFIHKSNLDVKTKYAIKSSEGHKMANTQKKSNFFNNVKTWSTEESNE